MAETPSPGGYVRRQQDLQGYLAHKNPPPSQDPTVALCLGNYGDPRGVGVSYERGTPVEGGSYLHLGPTCD